MMKFEFWKKKNLAAMALAATVAAEAPETAHAIPKERPVASEQFAPQKWDEEFRRGYVERLRENGYDVNPLDSGDRNLDGDDLPVWDQLYMDDAPHREQRERWEKELGEAGREFKQHVLPFMGYRTYLKSLLHDLSRLTKIVVDPYPMTSEAKAAQRGIDQRAEDILGQIMPTLIDLEDEFVEINSLVRDIKERGRTGTLARITHLNDLYREFETLCMIGTQKTAEPDGLLACTRAILKTLADEEWFRENLPQLDAVQPKQG